MMKQKILSQEPLIITIENFLSDDECQELITSDTRDLEPSKVTLGGSKNTIDENYRSSTGYTKKETPIVTEILNRIKQQFDISSTRCENVGVVHYDFGQQFKTHVDYFSRPDASDETIDPNCEHGGNRCATIVIYLNDVNLGGETYFPWLDLVIKPSKGTLLYFEYGYDDYKSNVQTHHCGMPVLSGEKWAITIFVREQDRSISITEHKLYTEENKIYDLVEEISYELECGPESDRQMLSLTLPGNTNPINTILVNFTGDASSCLLLYLLGMLNNMQEIPYIIQPVMVTNKFINGQEVTSKKQADAEIILELITENIGGNIKSIKYLDTPIESGKAISPLDVIFDAFYFPPSKDFLDQRFRKNCAIFINSCATSDDLRLENELAEENMSMLIQTDIFSCLQEPFKSLQSYHIFDACIQLDLIEILLASQQK